MWHEPVHIGYFGLLFTHGFWFLMRIIWTPALLTGLAYYIYKKLF